MELYTKSFTFMSYINYYLLNVFEEEKRSKRIIKINHILKNLEKINGKFPNENLI